MSKTHWVAGVDGCRSGWVVVLHDLHQQRQLVRVVPDFLAVLTLPENPVVITVDMPIGLLATARAGGRECERIARQLLGSRRSSVFSAPTRGALGAFRAGSSYPAVVSANRGGLASAPGITQQAFGILPKINEVDRAVTPAMQGRIREVHPELCFAKANNDKPMTHAKKGTSGRTERTNLLKKLGFSLPLQLLGKLPKGVKADDLLDACIACWTAARVAKGTAIVVPDTPPTDSRKLRMEMWR